MLKETEKPKTEKNCRLKIIIIYVHFLEYVHIINLFLDFIISIFWKVPIKYMCIILYVHFLEDVHMNILWDS